jgi:aarF domain-containing kinase
MWICGRSPWCCTKKYRVEIDPAMSSVVVSMLVLEGLGRSLDPDLNLIKATMPFLLTGGKV